jgi:chorismate synthase
MEEAIIAAKSADDSLAVLLNVLYLTCLLELGTFVDALDADLAKALFGVSAVKGVELALDLQHLKCLVPKITMLLL